ncbi:hypothetical protein [Microbulbifer sp. PSTR4-B]|uniref:hypothetical protein n=1 Tax=unclassified Microbulbifer TaxID=2619833 RepID=UPI00403A9320
MPESPASALEKSLIAEARLWLGNIQRALAGEIDDLAERYAEHHKVPIEEARRCFIGSYLGAFGPLDNLAYSSDSGLSPEGRQRIRELSGEARSITEGLWS